MALFTLISNRLLIERGAQIFKKRVARWPLACILGGLFTYPLNVAVFRKIQYNDYEELGLMKYLELDLNADMMRKDLEEKFKIRIRA